MPFIVLGQNGRTSDPENIATVNDIHKQQVAEKLYIHIDRPVYSPGDTIWYKAYLLNESLSGSKSGILYLELVNDSNRIVKREVVKITNGTAIADIALRKTFSVGKYTLRAYTNWMRNFGTEHFFTQQIRIMPADDKQWLVNEDLIVDKDKNANLVLHFTDATRKNLGFRDILLTVSDGNSNLFKSKFLTDSYGNIKAKFPLSEKKGYKHLSVLAEDISKGSVERKMIIPLQLNRPKNIDLQFLPEGGVLLAGLPATVGFKAIGEDGNGINELNGYIYNNTKDQVAAFKPLHGGMGSFVFTPQVGVTYTAKITCADGTANDYTLPAVKSSGISIQVKNISNNDSLQLQISATLDIINNTRSFSLIGLGRDRIYYAENVSFAGKQIIKRLAKSIFPSGIVKFILLDINNQTVCRRMVFVDHHDQLNISFKSNKPDYTIRDSVGLQISVTNALGKPIKGNFSLAVTDDNKVNTSPDNVENIMSYMLLTSELEGTVEDPGYYFIKANKDRTAALDNLMLTQGWVNYNWKQIFSPAVKLPYECEDQFVVKGKASNIFNKPIRNTEITLESNYPPFTLSTMTDKDGRFVFKDFRDLERIEFLIKSTREFNVGITVDEFTPPDFKPIQDHSLPWFVNSDSTLVRYITDDNKVVRNIVKPPDASEQQLDRISGRLLKEVAIVGRRRRPPPTVSLSLDEEEVRNARAGSKPLTLMNLLNLKGKISHMYKRIMVDETPYIPFSDMTSMEAQHEINRWLEYYTTEDITDILVENIFINTKLGEVPAISITIKTNAHKGPEMAGIGGYAYRPIPFSAPHEFYRPRYTVKNADDPKTRRPTIFWAPNINTDASGRAEVSFYTGDLPGSYTLIANGGDMTGSVGYQKQQLKINK